MASESPKFDPRVVAAYLDDSDLELDAARRLIQDPPNRFAAFHLEQAAEKLVKAVRLGSSLRVTNDHNIEALIEELPSDSSWRVKLPFSSRCPSTRRPIAIRLQQVSARTVQETTRFSIGSR